MVRALLVFLLALACTLSAALPFDGTVRPIYRKTHPALMGRRPALVYAHTSGQLPDPMRDPNAGGFLFLSNKQVMQLNKASTFASVLCAIDCTVFPLLIALQTFLGVGIPHSYNSLHKQFTAAVTVQHVAHLAAGLCSAGADLVRRPTLASRPLMLTLLESSFRTDLATGSGAINAAWLHKAAHLCALWFVVPVGGTAVGTNFIGHRNPWLALWGCCGLFLVLLANLHLHFLPEAIEHFLHVLRCDCMAVESRGKAREAVRGCHGLARSLASAAKGKRANTCDDLVF